MLYYYKIGKFGLSGLVKNRGIFSFPAKFYYI